MTELDKKIQKTQTDLVQAVLEAQEKRNFERVDMLVTNAIKQLKMSRFKPDQTTCISLAYLARINAKVFLQSSAIKELLKSLLRRDNGPANIKGKNDIVLPVLSANILLACCDSTDNRLIILNKIEQWLASNQKMADIVQHLLATICMKCQGDPQTIAMLNEMRHHWLQHLEDNFITYGCAPPDLCASIRRLLHSETSCDSLVMYLKFLIKHDTDVDGLSIELAKFIIERPISLESMLTEHESAVQLLRLILKVFIKLFTLLGAQKLEQHKIDSTIIHDLNAAESVQDPINNESKVTTQSIGVTETQTRVTIKQEHKESIDKKIRPDSKIEGSKIERGAPSSEIHRTDKTDTKTYSVTTSKLISKDASDEPTKTSHKEMDRPLLYVKLANSSRVVSLNRLTTEAVLRLMVLSEISEDCKEELNQLLDFWRTDGKMTFNTAIYEDVSLTTPHNLSDTLRQKLVHSSIDYLIELGLQNANIPQLVGLIQQFGLTLTTINKIFKRLNITENVKLVKSCVKEQSFFTQLLEFYDKMGALGAKELKEHLERFIDL